MLHFKENVFGLIEHRISTQYNLVLIRKEDNTISNKDKIIDKYSYLKHLEKTNILFLPSLMPN